MQFKHSILLNPPNSQPYLTKQQVWQGMLDRVLNQHKYAESLDRCEIVNRNTWQQQGLVIRVLHYGTLLIRDQVFIDEPHQSIRIEVSATNDFPSSYCDMTLTESSDSPLTLHFHYGALQQEETSTEEESYVTYLRQEAYKSLDLDFVQQLRLVNFNQ